MRTEKPAPSSSHKKATLTSPISKKSSRLVEAVSEWRAEICAELSRIARGAHFLRSRTARFRAYVHTSSSGEIAAAGTAASAQYAR